MWADSIRSCCGVTAGRRTGRWWCAFLLSVAALWAVVPATVAGLDCEPLAESDSSFDFGPIAHPRGLLWRVKSPAGSISYLLGTMHAGGPETDAVERQGIAALAEVDAFAMEVVMDAAAFSKLQSAMQLPAGEYLSSYVEPALYERLLALTAGYGLPDSAVSTMKLWAASLVLSQPPGLSGLPMDLMLMQHAQSAGKPIIGLESVEEQVGIFDQLSPLEQRALLREAVCHYAQLQQELDEIVRLYGERDLAGLAALSTRNVDVTKQDFFDALINQRNLRMLSRLQPRLTEQRLMVAVGALHLPGPQGLLSLLEKSGFSVEPIY